MKHLLVALAAAQLSVSHAKPPATDDHSNLKVSKITFSDLEKNLKYPKVSAKDLEDIDGGTSKKTTSYKTFKALCARDESQFTDIQQALLSPFQNAIQQMDLKKVDELIAPQVQWKFTVQPNPGKNSIQTSQWVPTAKETTTSDFTTYLQQFSKIEDARIEVFKVWSPTGSRDKKTISMNQARLISRLDLRGLEKSGQRRHDKVQLNIDVSFKNNTWKMDSLQLLSGESLKKDKATFTEVATNDLSGLKSYERLEAIRRGGYALAVGDYNNDGSPDLYVGSYGASQILQNNGQGSFKVTDPGTVGLGNDTLVKSAAFADLDNDGLQDLVIVRFVPVKKDQNDFIVYKNKGGGVFARTEFKLTDGERKNHPMPMAVGDFDGNGLLDLYVGFPGVKDFTTLKTPPLENNPVIVQGLFVNQGGFEFKNSTASFDEATLKTTKKTTRWRQRLFPHSALATDLDLDGHPDLIVMDDRGHLSPIYANNGHGQFRLVNHNIGVFNRNFGMGTATGDLNNDGYPDIVMTNVNYLSHERMRDSCSANWNLEDYRHWDKGLRVFLSNRGKSYTEATDLEWAGEGMGGVELVDYDNDGNLDIYVTNGLWSGKDKNKDIGSTFVRASDFGYDFRQLKYPLNETGAQGTMSEFMSLLRNSPFSMAGHQRNRLFRNDGNGGFTDVAYLEGVDSINDGYMVATADLNKDGKMDLILRNADPGTADVKTPPVQIYLNKNTKDKSVILKLVGKKSNANGVGALVTAKFEKSSLLRELKGNNGTVQSEMLIQFGLGEKRHFDSIEIKWPSGTTSLMNKVSAGTYTVVEPIVKTASTEEQ